MNVRVLFLLFQIASLQYLYAELVEESEYDNAQDEYLSNDINNEQDEDDGESENIQDEISSELDENNAEDSDATEENQEGLVQDQPVSGSILSKFISKLGDAKAETAESSNSDETQEEESANIVEYTLPKEEKEEPIKSAENLRELLETDVIQLSEAKVQILDKASSVCRDQVLKINEPHQVGELTVTLKNAFMTAENVVPFSVIGFLEVKKGDVPIFQNWMSGTYKSAITFDHAIYDIKLTNDKN